jgi:hypothetical protein
LSRVSDQAGIWVDIWIYWTLLFSMALSAHSGPRPLFSSVIYFTQSVGLFGRGISPSNGRCRNTGQQIQNRRIHTPNIHAMSGIQTHDPSVRASEDSSCLRPRGYSDRLTERLQLVTTDHCNGPTNLYTLQTTTNTAHTVSVCYSVVTSHY